MKSKLTLQTLAALSALALPSTIHAQAGGALDPPPGIPAPSMKSLDQMEPRTPLIDDAPGVSVAGSGSIIISESGSYYLTDNLTVTVRDGVFINASGVTLDLRGFTISSSFATPNGTGIFINGSHVNVHNGHIISGTTFDADAPDDQFTGGGFVNGVIASDITSTNIHIRNLSVSGCNLQGIVCASTDATLVESCTVQTVGNVGIQAGTVRDCNASQCGNVAILADIVTNCRGTSTGASGIISFHTVSNSYGFTNAVTEFFHGISSSGTVNNSYGRSNDGIGINSSGTVNNSYGRTNGGIGIRSSGSVNNSYGYTNGILAATHGIEATRSVSNSFGWSDHIDGGDGINAPLISYSYGRSDGTAIFAVGIDATIAIGCIAEGGARITNRYLMP